METRMKGKEEKIERMMTKQDRREIES